jgi:hypothetical protein
METQPLLSLLKQVKDPELKENIVERNQTLRVFETLRVFLGEFHGL